MVSAATRLEWIAAFERTGDAASVCALYGISRPTLRKWWGRYRRHGTAGLAEASRAPRHSPGRRIFAAELAAARALQAQGLGARAIQAALREGHGIVVSESTVRRALCPNRDPSGPGLSPHPAPIPPSAAPVPSPPPPLATAGLFGAVMPDDPVFRRLAAAIASGGLRPGAPLDEPALAARLGAGRRTVRAAVRALAVLGLVRAGPGGAAQVAVPSLTEVAAAYEARRVIEGGIVRALAATADAERIGLLRQHLRRQSEAQRRGDRVTLVRLLTDFHLLLAAMAGNPFLRAAVEALASVTSLAVVLYDQSGDCACALDEHRALVAAIERGDASGAARLIARHLGANHARQSAPPGPPAQPAAPGSSSTA